MAREVAKRRFRARGRGWTAGRIGQKTAPCRLKPLEKACSHSMSGPRGLCPSWTVHSWASVLMECVTMISRSPSKSLKTRGRRNPALGTPTSLS